MESLADMPTLGWVALAVFVGFVAWKVIKSQNKGSTDAVGGPPPKKGGGKTTLK